MGQGYNFFPPPPSSCQPASLEILHYLRVENIICWGRYASCHADYEMLSVCRWQATHRQAAGRLREGQDPQRGRDWSAKVKRRDMTHTTGEIKKKREAAS